MSSGNGDLLSERLLNFFWEMASSKEDNNFEMDKDEFVFHMTDWSDDLANLTNLYSSPESVNDDDAARILQGFFYHALPHILAAAKIYDDAPEIFKMLSKDERNAEKTGA